MKNIFLTMTVAEFFAIVQKTYNEKDSGKNGDLAEMLVRSAFARKVVPYKTVKGQGKTDISTKKLSVNGKPARVEIKTGCGEIGAAERSADFVIYCPHIEDTTTVHDFRIMTGAEFSAMVDGYKGLLTYDKSRDKWKIKFAWVCSDGSVVRECLGLKKTAYLKEQLKKYPRLDSVLNG